MKRLTATLMAALMVLTVFAGVASAADTVEVRGPVYNGSSVSDIVDSYSGSSNYIEMNATNFAGFYYDLDDGLESEYLRIYNKGKEGIGENLSGDKIPEGALVYYSVINETDFEITYNNNDTDGDPIRSQYPVIGFFAEEYVPLKNTTPDKLAKLLLDNDDKYTLRTGSALELPNGYELTAKQIDVEGDKVWMELSKDGEFIEDQVVDLTGTTGSATWSYEEDVAGEDDVEVFRVRVTDVFQGQVDSLAVIEGVWMIDYMNVVEIDDDDTFGELEVQTTGKLSEFNNAYGIKMWNDNSMTLDEDDTEKIAEGLAFKTADVESGDVMRFYLMKEYTEPGTYEIRGQVFEDEPGSWTYANFAGFYYDLDDNLTSESLIITTSAPFNLQSSKIDKDELVYYANITETGFEIEYNEVDTDGDPIRDKYPVIGLFAEAYVPLKNDTPDLLAKLILDNDDKYTLRTGSALELPNGYELTAKQIDVEGDKVWMELSKDGEFIEDQVVDLTGTTGSATWSYEEDVAGEDDVEVFRVRVTDVFQGQVDSLAVIEGVWMIDYMNVVEIDDDDTFGELEVQTTGKLGNDAAGNPVYGIKMTNDNSITLDEDDTEEIAEGLAFKTADVESGNDTLRYYLYKEVTIEGEETTQPDEEEDMDEEEQVTDNETEGNDTVETPVDETPDETEEPPVEDEGNETTDEEPVPGFEAVFAVAGLLAVAYLVRRN
ncbi:PGF-CTERM sorting domain-containing protein [Methanolobus zinderi]|uniref:PGF-CTERM sorting domain-containing protein n=1 Tax=Methanolobus zinderi TaxID=536044 RepID=A0A7D5I6H0_9EURY|nr:S-layer protein domain-containing protein [Methanolobus zinderi]QLC51121.1 PGF-CTERM sorting domain-containing protein [Methanolobus zinderi]